MTAYSDTEKSLYAEATCVVPGIVACRERHERNDVMLLLNSYFETAMTREISKDRAWGILIAAMTHALHEQVKEVAFHREETVTEAAGRMAVAAAKWMQDTRGVSGY